jgi:PadR family transcriptional regulator, regulatory protein PadR
MTTQETREQAVRELDIKPKMAMVLKVFLEDPAQPRYGFEIMKRTGLASGSVYPILARLEAAGWLAKDTEAISPSGTGRPPRFNYTITPDAAEAARLQLSALSDIYRPPDPDEC